MQAGLLTTKQREQLKNKAADTELWRNDADLERRRVVGKELRQAIERAGILEGKTIDHRQLCEFVGLQWQIQNLNPMQMPKFLGLYAYKVHFGGFQGSREDLLALRKETTGKAVMYDGADLSIVSEAVRQMMSESPEDQATGAASLLAVAGAGQALVSGFLHLLHPDRYGLVNSPTKTPFTKKGWLQVTEQQRRKAMEVAKSWFANAGDLQSYVFKFVFRWEAFLREVYDACGFHDYHEVDQFLWTLATEPEGDADDRLAKAINAIRPNDLAARQEAEEAARTLVEKNLGQLTSEQYRELFTLLNTCHGLKGVVYTRFSPAFVGHNANLLVEQADELNHWIQELWSAPEDDVPMILNRFWDEKLSGGGRSFPTAILYLRDKEKYAVWTTNLEKALYSVIQGLPAKYRTGFSYLQYCKGVHQLRKKMPFPPEMHDFVLFMLIKQAPKGKDDDTQGAFTGFTADAFAFMEDLVQNNSQTWFDTNRQRFKDSLDRPLRALVKDLGDDVITPLDPGLETSPKSNKCIARIRKNVWGKTEENAYQELYWAAFYRKELTKNTDCQLFISIRPGWFQHGVFFGEQADPVREKLDQALARHPKLGQAIFDRLLKAEFLFAPGDSKSVPEPIDIKSYDEFTGLVKRDRFHVYRRLTPDEAVASGAQLKERIGADFRTLYPLFRLATSTQQEAEIWKLLDSEPDDDDDDALITTADLTASTFLEEDFFETLDMYLKDKRQLIFCGPPGTGKTYVALEYAEYLAQGGGEVRTVQFHPSYGYEDFIEGLRPVPSAGGLSYEIEDGIFKRLCDAARTNPKAKYVLIVDEINRGNIPRVFGELLFLLERREKTTELPYSKKAFSIPQNVVVLGTMNSSDRSIALMDFALRRRFHFVEMLPRGEVLLGWLQANKKPRYVRDIFVRLNDALTKVGIEEDRLIGHAHFMSMHLDDDFLKLIWTGTIEPLLKEYFFAEPEKLKAFHLDKFQNVVEEAVVDDVSEDEEETDDLAEDEA